jgi:hypothetical protein
MEMAAMWMRLAERENIRDGSQRGRTSSEAALKEFCWA